MRDRPMHPKPAHARPHMGPKPRPASTGGVQLPPPDARLSRARRYVPTDLRHLCQVIEVPDVGEIDSSEASLSESDTVQVEFRDDGWIVGYIAMGKSGETSHDARSALAVKLEIVGSQSAITNDSKIARFIQFSLLCPDVTGVAVEPFPLVRKVKRNDRVNVTYANYDTDTGRSPASAFYFLPASAIRPDAEPLPVGSDEPGVTRAILVPNQPTTLDDPLLAGEDGPYAVVEWQQDGTLLGFRADCQADDDGAINFTATMIEDPELRRAFTIKDGVASPVATQLLLGGNAQLMRLRERRSVYQKTAVQFRNIDEFSSCFPQGVFLFRGDEDARAERLSP